MAEDDPPRLKEGRQAPPELVRALEALRKGANEAPRLQRVATKLGPLLDAPPPIVSGAASGTASYKVTMIKLIVGGLALLAPVLWMMRGERSDTTAVVAKQPDPPAISAPAVQQPEPAQPAPEAPAQPRFQPQARDPRPLAQATDDRARRTTPRTQGRPQLEAAPHAATAPAAESATESAQAAEPAPSASAQRPEPPAQDPNRPQPEEPKAREPEAPEARATTPAPRFEAKLLFDAHQAMEDDPRRALRLLAEHERHYPEGSLVPEREVLAIEALRSLGRTAEANARLNRFKARYPDSLHLQRLQR